MGKLLNARNLLILAAIILVAVVVVFSLNRDNPTNTAIQFMTALTTRNAELATRLTNAGDVDEAELRKAWDFTFKEAAPNYQWRWSYSRTQEIDNDNAVVVFEVEKDLGSGLVYPERLEIPVRRTENGWKVEHRSIPRGFYPGLPR
jgi:hypothetical protein